MGAELARHDDRAEPDEDRQREQEHAGDAVQRQGLGEVVLAEEVVRLGLEALGSEGRADTAADDEEHQRRADPQAPDRAMPTGAEQAGETARGARQTAGW